MQSKSKTLTLRASITTLFWWFGRILCFSFNPSKQSCFRVSIESWSTQHRDLIVYGPLLCLLCLLCILLCDAGSKLTVANYRHLKKLWFGAEETTSHIIPEPLPMHIYAALGGDELTRHQQLHYKDAIMSTMASQITSLTAVYLPVYTSADQRKLQSSASLGFVREHKQFKDVAL